MVHALKAAVFSLIFAVALSLIGVPTRAQAQSYAIDCAILLCLSGGWPASEPCMRARAEFMRRITPWPIEPPLQIWRCPMGASHVPKRGRTDPSFLVEALFDEGPTVLPQSFAMPGEVIELRPRELSNGVTQRNLAPLEAQNRVDVDISGPSFDFVRSIRVFNVAYATQSIAGRSGDCVRTAKIFVGTYDFQGRFSWAPTVSSALPKVHSGLELWGLDCPNVYHRSVFVDWYDYQGNYGNEQVNY
ncbi:hypothetical protein SAMN05444149_109114 [Pseudosulfitobacter pseudonitzschiae]|uniref:hypothetical protein n=1 Tax=Pseudosulfitobacter pseudonitzschiae TaxID=1402135 RepID=UPI000913C459|nr:hypothetical protein [Pseudosulfitobacter pseudonitzschiae]QKS10979.1 hypothetical protein HT745_20505 [Pseudosulfitobacter pseudonitzschiae]SHG07634.1 hypothetical protein SAMN05444149_109114 [Pseudosulfitobacter pseudonitzschiae]